jgi:type I restriction and modification enzyme subunit R-like protein
VKSALDRSHQDGVELGNTGKNTTKVMASVPSKVADRLVKGMKRFQPILANAKSRDDGEADTVMIVTDMLAEVFGYDKYSEVTAEYSIRGTYCDLATKIEGQLQALIEVKAVGLELKDAHVKQAVDYAANQGVDWVVLTNGLCWRVYKVTFTKPIDHELVIEIDFCALDSRSKAHLEQLYLWCKEGWVKSVLGDYHTQKQALSRFFLGAMVLSDPVLEVIRRELRRVSPDVRIETSQIKEVLANEVIKREVMEGEKADEAVKKIARAASKALRSKASKDEAPVAVATSPAHAPAVTHSAVVAASPSPAPAAP